MLRTVSTLSTVAKGFIDNILCSKNIGLNNSLRLTVLFKKELQEFFINYFGIFYLF